MNRLLLSFALIILSLDSLACLKIDACEADMNYAIGEINKQNYKDAIPPLERCSTSQVKEIQNFCSNVLGSFYLEGLGVKQNYEKSLTYFNYTAGMDSDYKNQVIKWIEKAENGIKKVKLKRIADAKKAEAVRKKSAEVNNTVIKKTQPFDNDYIYILENAIKNNYGSSDLRSAAKAFKNKDFKRGVVLTQRCIKSKEPWVYIYCSNLLGSSYLRGYGVDKNPKTARSYLIMNYSIGSKKFFFPSK